MKFFRSGEDPNRRKLRAMVESQKAAKKVKLFDELGEGTPAETHDEDAKNKIYGKARAKGTYQKKGKEK